MALRALPGLAALALLASCAALPPTVEEPVARAPEEERPAPAEDRAPTLPEGLREIDSGPQSAIRVPFTRVIHDPELWLDFWAAHTANRLDAPSAPQIDFDRRHAIVLLLGERSTGGYAVRVSEVVERASRVEVVVEVQRPQPGDMVTQAITSPYFIATLPATSKEIVFTGDSVGAGFVGD